MEDRHYPTVSDQTRNEVWHAFWSAKRCAAYYQSLHRRFTVLHQVATGLMIILGSGSFLSAFFLATVGRTSLPEWMVYVLLGLGVLLAIVSAISMVGNHASKGAIALSIAKECDGVVRRFSNLMSEIDGGDINESRARLELTRILQDVSAITYRSGDIGIVDNERLNRVAADQATDELTALYGQTNFH